MDVIFIVVAPMAVAASQASAYDRRRPGIAIYYPARRSIEHEDQDRPRATGASNMSSSSESGTCGRGTPMGTRAGIRCAIAAWRLQYDKPAK
jgi:hypothetical protein